MLTARKKKNIVEEHGKHEGDTGSAGVQIALLSRSIEELTSHLRKNPKDHHSRKGLLKMVSKRRKLLNYLSRTDSKKYNTITKKLGLKKD